MAAPGTTSTGQRTPCSPEWYAGRGVECREWNAVDYVICCCIRCAENASFLVSAPAVPRSRAQRHYRCHGPFPGFDGQTQYCTESWLLGKLIQHRAGYVDDWGVLLANPGDVPARATASPESSGMPPLDDTPPLDDMPPLDDTPPPGLDAVPSSDWCAARTDARAYCPTTIAAAKTLEPHCLRRSD